MNAQLRWRMAAVWLAITATASGLALFLRPALIDAHFALRAGTLAATPFDVLLSWCCAGVAAGVLLWWWLASTSVLVAAARGDLRATAWGCPDVLRRLILLACGVAVLTGPAAAHASGSLEPREHRPPGIESATASRTDLLSRDLLSGLTLPDRVSAPASTVVAPPPAPRHAAPPPVTEAQHTVRPGESLWVIASRQLGADASTAEIDRQWRAIYARNRSAIGADPNLIEPGQRLTLPPAPAAPAQEKP